MAPSLLESTHAVLSRAPILRSRANTTLKSRAASGETLYGLFLMSASPTIAEIAGLAGYDFVVVDMEHGPGGISEAFSCIRALAAAGTSAIIRVPEKSAAWAKKALDLGPQGIMLPMVENDKIAEQVVSYCRYPPRGIRGTAHVMVRASGYGTDDTYIHRCEGELLILCMVETEAGVHNIKDLGNPKAREVLLAAEKRVLAVQKAGQGPFLGGISTQQHKPEELRERGYNMVAGGVDVGLFRQAAVEDVQKFRRGAAVIPPNKNHSHGHLPSAA